MVSEMSKPDVGDEAPDFTLEGTEGPFTLSEHRGERVVLLFYPGDDTKVCTAQFSAYRDGSEELAELGAVFVGISTQGMESKEAFKAKYGLTMPLLADPGGRRVAGLRRLLEPLRRRKAHRVHRRRAWQDRPPAREPDVADVRRRR